MKKFTIHKIAILFLLASFPAIAQGGSVQTTLMEQGKPVPGALVVLQRLKDGDCVKLFNNTNPSANDLKKAESCKTDLPDGATDADGKYSYQQLSPGFYDVRFLWSLRSAPGSSRAIACAAEDWGVFYEPGRDRTGKYDAMAQGRPFELKEGEARQISFDYRNQFETQNCLRRPADVETGSKSGRSRLSLPGHRGVLELDPGATTWRTSFRDEGETIYLEALHRRDHLLVTAFLQQVAFTATPEKCRNERWRKAESNLRSHNFDLGHIKKSLQDGMARVEFFIDRGPSGKLEMEDIHAYVGSGNLCGEVHLSKVTYQSDDKKLFEEVLSSIRFLPDEAADEPVKQQ
jgi:hypothetical protein